MNNKDSSFIAIAIPLFMDLCCKTLQHVLSACVVNSANEIVNLHGITNDKGR